MSFLKLGESFLLNDFNSIIRHISCKYKTRIDKSKTNIAIFDEAYVIRRQKEEQIAKNGGFFAKSYCEN
jgi:hypothetical protein